MRKLGARKLGVKETGVTKTIGSLLVLLLLVACGRDLPEGITVDLTADKTQGQAPLTVNFSTDVTGTGDDASNAVGYLWDFGTSETVQGSSSRAYTFEEAGTYEVTVVAREGASSATDTVAVTVTGAPEVPDNAPPEVELIASDIAGQAPFEVAFTTKARDPDGDDLSYSWNFGDGATAAESAEGTRTHRYETPGLYTATVTVSDGEGGFAEAALEIAVAPGDDAEVPEPVEPPVTPGDENRAPTVTLSADPARGEAPLTVSFNAQASDPDDDDLLYAWDFGNGETATGNSSHTVTYREPGSYTASVVVSDGTLEARSSFEVLVEEAPEPPAENTPPSVTVETEPSEGRAPLEVALTATAEDAEGGELSYLWDFGDGSISGENPVTHLYEEPGSYTASVTVSDPEGAVTREEVEVEVGAPDPDEPPTPDVPFYGEWAWAARAEGGKVFEGFLSISERAPEPDPEFDDTYVEGGTGVWTYCPGGVDDCGDPTGVGYIDVVDYGQGEEFDIIFIGEETQAPVLVAFDDDGEVGREVDGAPTLMGGGAWFYEDGSGEDLSFAMVKIDDQPSVATLSAESAQLRERLRHSSSE